MKKMFYWMLLLLLLSACTPFFEKKPALIQPAPTQEAAAFIPAQRLLPHTLYYIADGQVFRMEPDGTTIKQITNETVEVINFDVSAADGSIAYVTGNQLFLADSSGSNRRLITNSDINGFYSPAFSPDGKTLAYHENGIIFYDVLSGTSRVVMQDKPIPDMPMSEGYFPQSFSPDGSRLLLGVGYTPTLTWTGAVYSLTDNSMFSFVSAKESLTCCMQYGEPIWSADGSFVYAIASTQDSTYAFGELWKVDSATGSIAVIIPAGSSNATINFPFAVHPAADGQLFYFFINYPDTTIYRPYAPLQLVHSAADGANKTILRSETFDKLNEALWSPDESFVITATAPDEDTPKGGRADLLYLDGRPAITLTQFAWQMKWGP